MAGWQDTTLVFKLARLLSKCHQNQYTLLQKVLILTMALLVNCSSLKQTMLTKAECTTVHV